MKPVNVAVTREEMLTAQRRQLAGLIIPLPPEGSVSECCGAQVLAVAHAVGTIPVCGGCRRSCVGGEGRARPRACSACWHHVDLAEWRNCGSEFCRAWESMKVLSDAEAAKLDLRPRKDLEPRVRRASA